MAEDRSGLFKRAKAGDRDAFWALVAPHRGLIYSVALGILKDPERAEDQVHDALVTAHRSLANLRRIDKLPSWLHSVTRNRIMELSRREQRERRAMGEAARGAAHVVSMTEATDKEQWMAHMETAISGLPEPFRVVLAMKYTNNYSCRDMGEILEISVSAVKSRLFEARKLLRRQTEARVLHDEEQGHELH